jgi:hypothetical protein
MWIGAGSFEKWLAEREHERSLFTAEIVKLQEENKHLAEREAQARRDMDWLRIRVNALEHERAALLAKTAGVLVPTPVIARELDATEPDFQNALQLMDIVGKDDRGDSTGD